MADGNRQTVKWRLRFVAKGKRRTLSEPTVTIAAVRGLTVRLSMPQTLQAQKSGMKGSTEKTAKYCR